MEKKNLEKNGEFFFLFSFVFLLQVIIKTWKKKKNLDPFELQRVTHVCSFIPSTKSNVSCLTLDYPRIK